MKNWIISLYCSCSLVSTVAAQQLSPTVLASDGGSSQTSSVQLDWTLGELATQGLIGQAKNYTEGFHQPILVLEQVDIKTDDDNTSQDHELKGITGIKVAPNPVNTALSIHFDKAMKGEIICQVYDASGTPQLRQQFQASLGDVQLDLSGLAPGIFFIRFIDEEGSMTVFKLAKTR